MEFERLAKLIADVLNIPATKVRRDSRLKEDLGADSLDVFQIVINVEEELQVEVDPTKAEKVRTVEDILALSQQMAGTTMPGGEN